MTDIKVGDLVECIDNCQGYFDFTVGKVYTVTGVCPSSAQPESAFVSCVADEGYASFMYAHRFRKVEPPRAYIALWQFSDGTLSPVDSEKFASEQEAIERTRPFVEAGDKFVIAKIVSTHSAELTITSENLK